MLFTYNADLAAAAASPLMTESAEGLASASLWVGLGLLVVVLVSLAMHAMASIKELAQTRRFQAEEEEEIIECLGLEDISAQEYIDLGLDQDDGLLEVETDFIQIIDNVIYLDTEYAPEQDVVPMEQDGVSVRENVQMAVWTVRRGFRSMVKFVKDLANAPARIRELEKELAELKKQQFDFDYYSDEEDEEVVTWVNKA